MALDARTTTPTSAAERGGPDGWPEKAAGWSKMLAEEVYEMRAVLTSRDNLTILIVDQEIRQALKIADYYVYVLELGRNKFEGKASEFQDLEKAFWVG